MYLPPHRLYFIWMVNGNILLPWNKFNLYSLPVQLCRKSWFKVYIIRTYAFNKVKIIHFFRLLRTTADYYLDTLQVITKPTEFDAGWIMLRSGNIFKKKKDNLKSCLKSVFINWQIENGRILWHCLCNKAIYEYWSNEHNMVFCLLYEHWSHEFIFLTFKPTDRKFDTARNSKAMFDISRKL